jgi:hypothetical protein
MITHVTLLASAGSMSSGGAVLSGSLIGAIPTDPATVFTTLLLTSCVALVLWAGSRGGGDD